MKKYIAQSCEKFKDKTRFFDKFNYTKNKDDSITVSCDNLILFKVYELKNTYRINSKIKVMDPNNTNITYIDDKDSFFRYSINNKYYYEECLHSFLSVLMQDIDSYILCNYSAEPFGCCSRYISCSNEKQCVHPDVLHSKGCIYRKNLESGKIFYGKNKNIKFLL